MSVVEYSQSTRWEMFSLLLYRSVPYSIWTETNCGQCIMATVDKSNHVWSRKNQSKTTRWSIYDANGFPFTGKIWSAKPGSFQCFPPFKQQVDTIPHFEKSKLQIWPCSSLAKWLCSASLCAHEQHQKTNSQEQLNPSPRRQSFVPQLLPH